MIAAQGDFLEAAAIARRHHAAAAEQEIKNSVEWVRAYFERKELESRLPPAVQSHLRSELREIAETQGALDRSTT